MDFERDNLKVRDRYTPVIRIIFDDLNELELVKGNIDKILANLDEDEYLYQSYKEMREYIEFYVREEDKWHDNRPSLTVFVDKMIPFISLTMVTLPIMAGVIKLTKRVDSDTEEH